MHQGDAESSWKERAGGGKALEHPSARAGGCRGAAGLLPITRVPVLQHRLSPAEGWGTALLSQQVQWVMSRGTGEAWGGIWGRAGPRSTEPPLKYSELGCSPHCPRQGRHGLTRSPRGRSGHILPLWGDSCAGSPWGTVQGIVQGSASAPQNLPLAGVLTPQPGATPVMPMGGGTAPKSLQQQWAHSTSRGY